MKIFSKPHGYQFTKLGHALELHKLGGVYIQRLWVYRLPLALAWWARGSTAVKRSLFNSGVGRNIWLSIQIFDLNRRDPAEPLSDQAPGRSLVYTDADPTVRLSNFKISKISITF